MEQNLISVIMPVYKTEESHLRKAIESVINQSYRKLEIVLVDDGSPDQCGAICDAYAGTDNRIRVILNEQYRNQQYPLPDCEKADRQDNLYRACAFQPDRQGDDGGQNQAYAP